MFMHSVQTRIPIHLLLYQAYFEEPITCNNFKALFKVNSKNFLLKVNCRQVVECAINLLLSMLEDMFLMNGIIVMIFIMLWLHSPKLKFAPLWYVCAVVRVQRALEFGITDRLCNVLHVYYLTLL